MLAKYLGYFEIARNSKSPENFGYGNLAKILKLPEILAKISGILFLFLPETFLSSETRLSDAVCEGPKKSIKSKQEIPAVHKAADFSDIFGPHSRNSRPGRQAL